MKGKIEVFSEYENKGGENMCNNFFDEMTLSQKKFYSFMIKTINNARRSLLTDFYKRAQNEISISEFDCEENDYIEDRRANEEVDNLFNQFDVLQDTIVIENDDLYDALSKIDKKERNIVLMSCGLNMSDQDTGEKINMNRRTVNDIKNKTYKKLRKIMEETENGAGKRKEKKGKEVFIRGNHQ